MRSKDIYDDGVRWKMKAFYTVEKFKSVLNNCSEIICIGIGFKFEQMMKNFNCAEVADNFKMLVDNTKSINKEKYIIGNKEFDIQPMESAANIVKENTIIIITCNAYSEILNQLSEYKVFDNVEVICYSHIQALIDDEKALNIEVPDNLKISEVPLIPKKIHYCWFGKNPIPDKYKEWMKSWKKYCPDYEIIEWNESNYDVTKNKYMYQAYKCKKWGFVPDYARLDIIYNHGGIYLDTDVELIKNLDHILYQKAFAGFETNNHIALGLGFGAVKYHPLLKVMMEQYDTLEFIDKEGQMNLVASPIYQTNILLERGLKLNGEYQIIDDMTIFPEKMFCAKSLASRLVKCKDYTCSIHHYDASWQSDNKRNQAAVFEMDMNIIDNLIKSDATDKT